MDPEQLQEQVPDMTFVMVVVGLAGELVAGTEAETETEAAVKMQLEDKNFEVRMQVVDKNFEVKMQVVDKNNEVRIKVEDRNSEVRMQVEDNNSEAEDSYSKVKSMNYFKLELGITIYTIIQDYIMDSGLDLINL